MGGETFVKARRETLTASRKKKAKKLLANQQFPQARQRYAEICRIDPHDYEAWLLLAELSARLGALSDAEAAYKHAAALRPQEAKPALNLGRLYKDHGRFNDAEAWLRRYAQQHSAGIAEYKRLGTDLQQRGLLDLSINIYRNLLEQTPECVDAWNNLGVALHNCGQLDKALAAFNRALEAAPPTAHLYCNIANAYVDKCDYEQADYCYQQALNLDPDFVGANYSRSMLHLLLGDFRQGWREHDARLNLPGVVQRFSGSERTIPMWEGQPIPGKTLLVYGEQGFGDSIQFCRYLPLLQQRVDHLVFEVRPELLRLMRALPGNIECVARRDDLGMPATHFDYHIPLMSLPRIFDTTLETIPAQVPYLHAEAGLMQQWRRRVQGDGLKVGLVWAGSPTHRRDRYRSLTLKQLAPLLNLQNVSFYSLQMGPAAQQIAAAPADIGLVDPGAEITDFADTAAIIANLDLVISVDTSVAHLAGALGKPVWLLVYSPGEWRWLLDREDSPWYPTMRLFRQGSDGNWELVLQRLVAALQQITTPALSNRKFFVTAV